MARTPDPIATPQVSPPQHHRPRAFVLAGGQATRFAGTDKARLTVRNVPLITHIVEALTPAVASVEVIGRTPNAYADMGLRTLTDLSPGAGPLSGLHRALRACAPDDSPLLLVACDLYGLDAAWVDTLRVRAQAAPDALAVAFCGETASGGDQIRASAGMTTRNPRGWEPLFALYSPRLLSDVEARLGRGDNALWRLLDACGAHAIPRPSSWSRLVVVNTPEDLARAEGFDLL